MTRAQGSFWRFDIPTKRYEPLMTGMRNAVGYAFNLLGEMFYFDSDMEPEIGTPWYRPVRTAHGVPNADFGFRYGSNKFPADYFDTLPAMRNDGRGSGIIDTRVDTIGRPSAMASKSLAGTWPRVSGVSR